MNAYKRFIKVILNAMWVKSQNLGGGPILMEKNLKTLIYSFVLSSCHWLVGDSS
jgi:hypothetical protein